MGITAITGTKCVVIGDEPLAAQCIQLARSAGLDVVGVATVNPIVQAEAEAIGVDSSPSDVDLETLFSDLDFDVLLSVANLRILPDSLLERASVAVNFHDGPLPDYAGLNTTTWAILDAVDHYAVTWHLMSRDVDGGEIVDDESFDVARDDSAFALNARCYEAALASFPRVAAALATGTLHTRSQPERPGRMFRRRDRPARAIWPSHSSASDIARLVRALDLGHLSTNTIGVPLLHVGNVAYVVTSARIASTSAPAGQIVSVDGSVICVGTLTTDVHLDLAALDGSPISSAEAISSAGRDLGDQVNVRDESFASKFEFFDRSAAGAEEFWRKRLLQHPPTSIAPQRSATDLRTPEWETVEIDGTLGDAASAVARVALWASRLAGTSDAVFEVVDATTLALIDDLGSLVSPPLVVVPIDGSATVESLSATIDAELEQLDRHGAFPTDLIARCNTLESDRVTGTLRLDLDGSASAPGVTGPPIVLSRTADGPSCALRYRTDLVSSTEASQLGAQLALILGAPSDQPLAEIEILTAREIELLESLNDASVDVAPLNTIDHEIWESAARAPNAVAASFGASSVTYGELFGAAEAFASELSASGIGCGDRVGIALPRGLDMLIGVLATLRIGAAYVPLDPSYPEERLRYMIDDAELSALLARTSLGERLTGGQVPILDPCIEFHGIADRPEPGPSPTHSIDDLAYVMYTSGSTGKPKGVVLRHANVANFFKAMDGVIEHDQPGVWLAVTSLSFDISVLELLWTLARGFHVVIKPESGFASSAVEPAGRVATATTAPSPVSMSLFYFAAQDASSANPYRLLLEGARFADTHGFEAVWTPERHFHAFGGAYPNPSVISAAVAATTESIAIRAGSVVLPLHSPVRVAEEWAVVDNLSNGRVGISFAPGWQPNDFVLNPARYGRARDELPGLIDSVHRLWRGDPVDLEGHDGSTVTVTTLPRPVQPELPTWLTSAGSPSTFEQAGRLGVNVLTHLLGQSTDDLASNVARYRKAWDDAGHHGEGHVTLMMHTYLDVDATSAKELARQPMKEYLRTAVGLIKNMASTFPTFAGSGKDADEAFESLTDDELDQLLEMAAERYLETSGLFGTADDVAAAIVELAGLGVNEVACLIDFGIDTDLVISSFPSLARTKELIDDRMSAADVDSVFASRSADEETVAALVAEHGVTHLQCTPSLAAMLSADPADREALSSIDHLLVGGEALPLALGRELRSLLPGRFTNMYGPTETTIWSLSHEITAVDDTGIPIGRPVLNNTIYVLDQSGNRRPVGTVGELHIGGRGVSAGYHRRSELTAERFVERAGCGVLYATGDLVRLDSGGDVEFVGRADSQLKIRGHRIELGEIETLIDTHTDVKQSVVVARGQETDPILVAYVVADRAVAIDPKQIRDHVAHDLPPVMVPANVIQLDSFPHTPNGKVDRNALPSDVASPLKKPVAFDGGEAVVAEVWSEALGGPVGRDDNFFDIGAHSLLAVRVFRTLNDRVSAPLALTDLFRYPTVRALAAHIAAASASDTQDTGSEHAGAARGERRRRALSRRQS